ncbi:MAG TPA: hypothetical protein DEP29_06580 [Bifidobacterium sp.]|nr:hypothetical protein [Bifidobacterium sp.]
MGSLKVLDGEWEKRFEGPRRETQQSTSVSSALTFGNTKNKGVHGRTARGHPAVCLPETISHA